MKLYSLSYLASILLLLFCSLLQLISALQPVLLPSQTNVEVASKTLIVGLERRQDNPEQAPPPQRNPGEKPHFPPPPSDKNDITITEINVTLTTIIYASPYPTIHNTSNTAAAHQQQQKQQQTASSINDPNSESLKSKLEEDQAALRRMIMILSLVGGLGVIAVVATVVIFTRMRARNRKQREIEELQGNEGSTYELGGGMDQHSEDSPFSSSSSSSSSTSPHSNQHIRASHINSDENDDDDNSNQHFIEPSAPPALMMASIDGSSSSNTDDRRRRIMSLLSQTSAPSPSAPTAKELDAMIDEERAQQQQPTTSTYLQLHSHSSLTYGTPRSDTMCDHCSPLMTPEPPPPAYTPSAPPHYALPVEPVIVAPVTTTQNEFNSVLFPRRHSLGS